jgi:radical SAM protein with 4Fe4S-binding SPASM domain
MTNTTMLTLNQDTIPDTIEFLAQLGVPTIGLNALIYSGKGKTVGTGLKDQELQPLLTAAQEITTNHHQKLIWYTPTQYCHFDPVELNLGIKGCSAALYNMCLEPDGSVLPCQSYYSSVGNILSDPWEKIWNHELCVQLRGRKHLPQKCSQCLIRSDCGGGCPLIFEDTVSDSFSQAGRQ